MTVKIYIHEDNTAVFVCPECQKTSIKDVSKYASQNKIPRLKAKCTCGHSYEVFLEKRKKFRKPADLPGTYKYAPENMSVPEHTGAITVKDLSYTGLRIKLQLMPRFKVGDMLWVEFRLDDANRSLIKKKVIVKNMKGLSAGLEYASPQSHDSVLGFYLFN
ncbi:MAG: PilZ domain-containing protein [Desulfosalsimonadaceae bacterium]|nr:PilZ domain-containing protein [Desulfosalsimonadaceae bacterium]